MCTPLSSLSAAGSLRGAFWKGDERNARMQRRRRTRRYTLLPDGRFRRV